MEDIHGVDTSWLHHSRANRAASTSSAGTDVLSQDGFPPGWRPDDELSRSRRKSDQEAPLTNGNTAHLTTTITTTAAPTRRHGAASQASSSSSSLDGGRPSVIDQSDPTAAATPNGRVPAEIHLKPAAAAAAAAASTGTAVAGTAAANTIGNSSSAGHKAGKEGPGKASSPGVGRKSSWISSLSLKLSGKGQEQKDNQQVAQANAIANRGPASPRIDKTDSNAVVPSGSPRPDTVLTSTSPRSSGFLTSALRRLSSSSGAGSVGKVVTSGPACARRTMNVDPHRDRCSIDDLQPSKLRRVTFCVDVEIAATPVYHEDAPEDPTITTTAQQRKRSNSGSEKKSKVKTKERAEGEALKHPNSMAQKKDRSSQSDRPNTNDMFDVSDLVDEISPETPNPALPTRRAVSGGPTLPTRPSSSTSPPRNGTTKPAASATKKKQKSSSSTITSNSKATLHHDFGPSGMFEVDDFDETPLLETKTKPQRSAGGALHHDFGRNGMFEVDDFDEVPKEKTKRQPGPNSGDPPHHDFGKNGMFEIPSDSENESNDLLKPETKGRGGRPDLSPKRHVPYEDAMFEIPDTTHNNTTDSRADDRIDRSSSANQTNVSPGEIQANAAAEMAKSSATQIDSDNPAEDADGSTDKVDEASPPPPAMTRKKEKKKKSEEERKERKEKKRQAAIANGTIPVELTGEGTSDNGKQVSNKPKIQNRPTTDPLRIYRRCCSLRETAPLPKVVHQLSSPKACDPLNPAIVLVLDLAGQPIELADLVTLGDWLGVVPVQKLVLDGCSLTDEGIRIVLSALLAVKTSEQARHNRHLAKKTGKAKDKKERLGVISKLSLKDNPLVGKLGWMHLGYFINMSKSLKAIDLSMTPFPAQPLPPSPSPPTSTTVPQIMTADDPIDSRQSSLKSDDGVSSDPFDLFAKCLAERRGGQLEEIVMSECSLSGSRIEKLIAAIIACRCVRFGFAYNDLDTNGLRAIRRYLQSGNCEGIDLGGNDFSSPESQDILLEAINYPNNTLHALSLADTKINPAFLKKLMPILTKLREFRFMDLSGNQALFGNNPTALPTLARYLPRMADIKRFHLNNVNMQSDHAIALADILPEIPTIAHVSLLDNPALIALAYATDEATQEEACALYASLMAAARVSKTIVYIDIEVPSPDNSEVVKALAKQVVAFSLRNMEHMDAYKSAAALISGPHGGEEAVAVPDILLKLVGHIDNPDDMGADEPPAPDQDYLVGGTGVVKALGVVLGDRAKELRRQSRDGTPIHSGTVTPSLGQPTFSKGKAKDVSKNLLDTARKIKCRLQPAIARARLDNSEDSDNYRRLFYLENTLEKMIQRFEEEYPECRQRRPRSTIAELGVTNSPDPLHHQGSPQSSLATALNNPRALVAEDEDAIASADEQETLASSLRRSRHGSDVSLASRNLMNEEGRIHRFGQRMQRTFEPHHIDQLRSRMEGYDGEEIKKDVEARGAEAVIKDVGASIDQIKELEREGGMAWEKAKMAGLAFDTLDKHGRTDSAIDSDEGDSGLEMTS